MRSNYLTFSSRDSLLGKNIRKFVKIVYFATKP
jgi:hypothetical protein